MSTEFDWAGTMGASPVFLILIGCSIVTLGVAIERILYYWKRRTLPDELPSRLIDLVKRGQSREAVWSCGKTVHPFAPVAATLLENADASERTMEEKIQIALSEQKILLERNLGMLGTMAAVAPLIGLLGTVVGIMRAFHDMAQVGNAAPAVVAAGVAEALLTTAAGLVVAVPAVMLYNHLARRANTMLVVAENQARDLRAAILDAGPTATDGAATEAPNSERRGVVATRASSQPHAALAD